MVASPERTLVPLKFFLEAQFILHTGVMKFVLFIYFLCVFHKVIGPSLECFMFLRAIIRLSLKELLFFKCNINTYHIVKCFFDR